MAWPEFIGENELDYCWVQNNDFKYSDLGQIKHFILYVDKSWKLWICPFCFQSKCWSLYRNYIFSLCSVKWVGISTTFLPQNIIIHNAQFRMWWKCKKKKRTILPLSRCSQIKWCVKSVLGEFLFCPQDQKVTIYTYSTRTVHAHYCNFSHLFNVTKLVSDMKRLHTPRLACDNQAVALGNRSQSAVSDWINAGSAVRSSNLYHLKWGLICNATVPMKMMKRITKSSPIM